MSSGEFHSVSTSIIFILPDRQRKEVDEEKDEQLRVSIQKYGLIHPIVISRDNQLVAGYRRLLRCRELGWTHISVQYLDEIDEDTKEDIEWEENERRSDLSWQEKHDFLIKRIERQKAKNPDWTQDKMAADTNKVQSVINDHLIVESFKNNPTVASSETFNKALKEAKRLKERAKADAWVNASLSDFDKCASPIIQADFHEWAKAYDGPKFNLIHCDFPYGINSQASGSNPSGYDDRPEVYWELIATLTTKIDTFCAESAHMIFWCSANIAIAHATYIRLCRIPGFSWDEVPLMWVKSDGKGIAPDPQRRFRRVYELAFFGWRGDRRHSALKDNAFAAPSTGEHPHAKPTSVLQHFFSGLVDANTRLLDPTCGSGSAIRAAMALGARRENVLGLERDPEYAADAIRLLRSEGFLPRSGEAGFNGQETTGE
jgi:ParB/RepB/Spo0J family partition protein